MGSLNGPRWHRDLEEDAENDFEIAEILKDTDGDPDLINKKVHACKSCGSVGMKHGRA